MKTALNTLLVAVSTAFLLIPARSSSQQAETVPGVLPPPVSRAVEPGPGIRPSGPTADMSWLSHQRPAYPLDAISAGIEGTTDLLVTVTAEGIPFTIVVEHSSGHRMLDEAAVAAGKQWRFNPARKNGIAVGGIARVPVEFGLGKGSMPALHVNPDWVAQVSYVDPEMLAKFERAAEGGDVDAENTVGYILLSGIGVPRDVAKGIQWYEKAAATGHPGAEFVLGMLYERGEAVPQDRPKAIEWYGKSAAHGNLMAMYGLGAMFYRGDGVPKDPAKAFGWFEKAAAQGHATAAYDVGRMLESGDGVPEDSVKAAEWFQKAAAQGQSSAEYSLGWMYAKGEGVPKDVPKAMDWYGKSAAQGNAMAENNLGWMLAQAVGVPKDSVKAMEWYRTAAANGNVPAYGNLGWMYEHGEGVPQDDVLAYAWLTVAAHQGLDARAAELGVEPETRDLPALEKRMTPDQLGEAKRLASSWVKGQLLSHDTK